MHKTSRTIPQVVLVLIWLCLPLGAAPCELSAGLCLFVAAFWGVNTHRPFLMPVLAIAAAWILPSLSSGTEGLIASLGEAWHLVLLIAIPPLLIQLETHTDWLKTLETLGLCAAAVAGLWAMGDLIASGIPPWVQPGRGPFSHHLTLGYALIPPASIAILHQRWVFGALIALGILAAGASGPLLALSIVLAAARFEPIFCLFAGLGLSLCIMLILDGNPELQTRITHWTAGAQVIVDDPGGQGIVEATHRFQSEERSLSTMIGPERHAHDSVLQWGMFGGVGAWLAWVWLLSRLWSQTRRAGKTAIAALGVSALTQDVFGDLEVIRALCAWCVLDLYPRATVTVSEPHQRGYNSTTVVSAPRSS